MDEQVHWVMSGAGKVHAVTLPKETALTAQMTECGNHPPQGQQWQKADVETLSSFCSRCLVNLVGALDAWDE
jgi:hypothetical protein